MSRGVDHAMQSKNKEFYKEHFANLEVNQLEELIQQDWQADGTLLNAEQVLAIA